MLDVAGHTVYLLEVMHVCSDDTMCLFLALLSCCHDRTAHLFEKHPPSARMGSLRLAPFCVLQSDCTPVLPNLMRPAIRMAG